LFETFGIL